MDINRSDVIWNYAATFFKIAASSLLLPFILRLMTAEAVGIWSVFVTVNSLIILLDFGFNPSFTRNITYVFSGVQQLKVTGFSSAGLAGNNQTDYGLLKGIIKAMKWFYFRIAFLFFLFLATVGTYYIYTLLKHYKGSHTEVYIAWGLLCSINTFNLSSLYYDSLLQGAGYIKKSRQIVIISQIIYLIIAAILIVAGKGLIAIVAAQASSVIIVRWMSHRIFFTNERKKLLNDSVPRSKKEILRAVYPNAVKVGLISLGAMLIQRSALVIGSLYLSLAEIASYGVTMQIITLLAALSGIYTNTYQTKLVLLRLKDDKSEIVKIYLKGMLIMVATYLTGGLGLMYIGNPLLSIIGSHTYLMGTVPLAMALFLSFEQTNSTIAGMILATKNVVPFFKATLVTGAIIITGLIVCFYFFNMGLLGMILIPLIADLIYLAWKYPWELIKDLKLKWSDLKKVIWRIQAG